MPRYFSNNSDIPASINFNGKRYSVLPKTSTKINDFHPNDKKSMSNFIKVKKLIAGMDGIEITSTPIKKKEEPKAKPNVNLADLTKKVLIEMAEKQGLEVNDRMKKDDIIKAIEMA